MSRVPGRQVRDLEELTLTDQLLDRLGRRDPDDADLRDPLALMLASLTVVVDSGPGRETPGTGPARPGAPRLVVRPSPLRGARSRLRRRTVAVVTGSALLIGVGGVAAAVTGDPLSPLHGIRNVFVAVATRVGGPPVIPTERAEPAGGPADGTTTRTRAAQVVTDRVAEVRRLLASGDVAGAVELLSRARATAQGLSRAEQAHLAASLAALERDVAAAQDQAARAAERDARADQGGGSTGPASVPATGAPAGAPASAPEAKQRPTAEPGGAAHPEGPPAPTQSRAATEPAPEPSAPGGPGDGTPGTRTSGPSGGEEAPGRSSG